jgi:hypothetical protein
LSPALGKWRARVRKCRMNCKLECKDGAKMRRKHSREKSLGIAVLFCHLL